MRVEAVTSDGQVLGVTKSFTRDDETKWHPSVDVQTGQVFCDCPSYRFHCQKAARALGTVPNVLQDTTICKHARRLRDNLLCKGELHQPGAVTFADVQETEEAHPLACLSEADWFEIFDAPLLAEPFEREFEADEMLLAADSIAAAMFPVTCP